MEHKLEETTTDTPEAAEPAPVRRRASRRVTAAAGAAGDVTITTSEVPVAETAAPTDAVEAPAAEAPAAAPKRATRSRKKVEPAADAAAETGAATEAEPATKAPAKTATKAAKAKAAAEAGTGAETSEAAAEPKKRATRARKTVAPEATTGEAEAPDAAGDATVAPKRATRSRKKAEPAADAATETAIEPGADSSDAAPAEKQADEKAPVAKAGSRRSSTKAAEAKAAKADIAGTDAQDSEAQAAGAQSADAQNSDAQAAGVSSDASPADEAADTEAAPTTRRSRRRSTSSGSEQNDGEQTSSEQSNQSNAKSDEGKSRGRGSRQDSAKADADKPDSNRENSRDSNRGDSSKADNGSRSSRTRQRDRKRRGGDEHELEISEDDVLLPIAGILDVLDNYAFVRTSGYLPGVSDVYVALGQVKKYGLRRGDAVVGAIRQPREGDGGGRQKYNAIVKIDSVNGKPVEETEKRPDIAEMTPVFPQQRVRLGSGSAIGRAIDAIAPIGLGQRGVIVLPSHFSGAEVVRDLAADISASTPDAHLMVVLTDAQPEVATELARSITGEVVAATFDRLPEDQTTISELGIDRARRLVELGHDVVVLVDSLNRLARGYAQSQQPAARPQLGVIDEYAVFQIKRLLAAARNVENGGSLTVLATASASNASEADGLLLREVKAVVNSVIELDEASPVEAPALNARESRTHNLQAMLDPKEVAAVAANRSKALGATTRSAK